MTDDPLTDDLRRARSGDREALDRILAKTAERLRRTASAHLGAGLRGRVRTSDVLQSTYLDVVRGLEDFQGDDEDAFVAWVTRIIQNNVRDKSKYFAARKRREPEAIAETEDVLSHRRPTPTPSQDCLQSENLVLVNRALEALIEDHRRIITLRLIQGRSHREVAADMDRTESACRMLLARARAALACEIDRLRGSEGV